MFGSSEMHRSVVHTNGRAKRVKAPPNEKISKRVVLYACSDGVNRTVCREVKIFVVWRGHFKRRIWLISVLVVVYGSHIASLPLVADQDRSLNLVKQVGIELLLS